HLPARQPRPEHDDPVEERRLGRDHVAVPEWQHPVAALEHRPRDQRLARLAAHVDVVATGARPEPEREDDQGGRQDDVLPHPPVIGEPYSPATLSSGWSRPPRSTAAGSRP